MRKLARNEGRRYCNTTALTYQAERMPEQIRLIVINPYLTSILCYHCYNFLYFQVGGPSQQQAAVYEEFARSLPGFLPNTLKVRMTDSIYVSIDNGHI